MDLLGFHAIPNDIFPFILFPHFFFLSFVPPSISTEKNAHAIGLGSYLCKYIPIHGAEYPFERFTAGISKFMARKIFIGVGMSAEAEKREISGVCVHMRYNKTGEQLWIGRKVEKIICNKHPGI